MKHEQWVELERVVGNVRHGMNQITGDLTNDEVKYEFICGLAYNLIVCNPNDPEQAKDKIFDLAQWCLNRYREMCQPEKE